MRNAGMVLFVGAVLAAASGPVSPVLAQSPSLAAGDLATWTGVSWSAAGSLPAATEVADVASWPDGYVLVGADALDGSGRQQAAIWSSGDLSTWSRDVTAGGPKGTSTLGGIVALPSLLVALGRSHPVTCGGPLQDPCEVPAILAWTSTDGRAWEELTGPDSLGAGNVTDAAHGHGMVLAVGDQGWSTPAIWQSSDGLAWEAQVLSSDLFADAHLMGVAPFSGGWVVTGMTGGHELQCCADGWGIDETRPAAWWSTDGVTWQRATLAAGASGWGAQLGAVHAGQDGLVAIDAGGPIGGKDPATVAYPQLWTSTDGRSWAPVAVDPATAFRPIASDGTGILAMDVRAGLAVSTNGLDWRTLDAAGAAPGRDTPRDWSDMTPGWLVADGLVARALDADGFLTRGLVLATPVTGTP